MNEIILPEMFQYTEPVLPDDCIHRISPSQIDKFFSYPKLYYEENIQGNKAEFQGNTATTLGSVCHYVYECVTKDKPLDRETVNKQIIEFSNLKPELALDVVEITNNWPLITMCVVNDYLKVPENSKGIIKSEQSVVAKVDDGIYVAGTFDRLQGDCVVDFKTVSKKPDENKIPFNYRIQLLAYAYALKKMGHEINRIRIVYGVAPTKTLPARCIVVTEQIDYEADKLIRNTLKLIAESVIICRNRPELVHLIFKSMDLKC